MPIPSSIREKGSDRGSRPRERELAILNSVAAALNASADLKASLGAALSQVAALFDLKTSWVFLIDRRTGEPYLAAAENLPPGLANHPSRMTGSCYCLDTFRQGDLNGAANVNVVTCSRLKWLAGEGTEGLRFHASVPLFAHGRELGVMNFASPEWRQLSPEDLRLLHTVGDMLGVAVERAWLFADSLETGAVEERSRLAREIHDTVAQGLTATVLHLDTADALLESGADRERIRAVLGEALRVTRANLDEVRRSVLDLRAAALEGRGLEDALAGLIEASRREGGATLRFECVGARPLSARIETNLYRIAQEALANAMTHAEARSITLRLTLEPHRALLTIEDDGRGFSPKARKPDRFGLVGLDERVRLLGGELRVESRPGGGARLEAALPLS
ncbi:two-component system, NarL family, sensor kinase [Rhizobiales bacterium GAS191]|nr:two-component system, NarL family, sensor kinase [Rhizobiales bacterium GAS191]